MHRTESATCFTNEIRKRWPRWTPSDVETGDWLVWLEKYEYADIAEAARAHLAESRYAKPLPNQLLAHARTLRASRRRNRTDPNRPQGSASGIPEAHTFIMCIARQDDKQGRLGWFIDILICPLSKTYSAETYRRVGAEQARRHSETYGGDWEVFTNTNHLEMMQCAAMLRGTQSLDINELRKRYKIKPRQ